MIRPLKLNLQRFAETANDNSDEGLDLNAIFGELGTPLDEYGDPIQGEGSAPADGGQANEGEGKGEGEGQKPDEGQPQGNEGQGEPPDAGQQQQGEPQQEQKPSQSAEENARFAAQRRQQEFEARVQQELQNRINQSPEFQMAQFLSKQSGLPVQEVYRRIQEQALTQQAQQQGVPVEVLKQINEAKTAAETAQAELQQVRFQAWQSRVNAEEAQLKSKYDFLTDDDWQATKQHMLVDLRNPELSLEQAVFSKFGATLLDKQKEAIRQEVLAEIGGRKQNALPPQGAKQKIDAPVLSADEKEIAKMFNMTDAEYVKWKVNN